MSRAFEQIDHQPTPIGDISLRRRSEPRLQGAIVYEVKLGDEFLMSSLFTEAEVQLARLGLAALSDWSGDREHGLDVVVGGLGLGYTAAAVLHDSSVGSLAVVEVMQPVIDWHRRGLNMPIAINVSALQFQQPQFVDRVAETLSDSGLPPQLLELELTESILVRDADEALQRLQALARIGVRLSIDDFGTGYSSLAYLKRFPIDKLKIDRSFVMGLPGADSDSAIVVAILQMASALGMKVIAEGVETESQRRFLLDSGCHDFQGYLYAPALDSLSFEKRLHLSQAHAETGEARHRVRCARACRPPRPATP